MTVNQRTLEGYKKHLTTKQPFNFLAEEYSIQAKNFTYLKGLHKTLPEESFSKLESCIEENVPVRLDNGVSTKSLELIWQDVKKGHLVLDRASGKHIYLVKSDKYYRVGLAANVNSRIASLQVGNPVEIELVKSVPIESEDCKLVDRLREKFVPKQARPDSQWFLLRGKEVEEIKEIMETLNGKTE